MNTVLTFVADCTGGKDHFSTSHKVVNGLPGIIFSFPPPPRPSSSSGLEMSHLPSLPVNKAARGRPSLHRARWRGHTSLTPQWESVPRLRACPPLPAQAAFPSPRSGPLPEGACAEALAPPLPSSRPRPPFSPGFRSREPQVASRGVGLCGPAPFLPPLPPLGSPASGDEAAAAAAPAAPVVAAVGAAGTRALRRGCGRGGAASAAAAGFPSSLA